MIKKILIEIPSDQEGTRADKALSQHPEIGTRSRAQHLFDHDSVFMNGRKLKASEKVHTGMIIEVHIPEPEKSSLEKLDVKLDVLYEDEDLIVVNKPSGLVVHPAAGHQQDTLVNALLHHTENLSMKFGDDRPGIVHRLDKETSGVLVVAKNDLTHDRLAKQFQDRTIHRIYWALALGTAKHSEYKIQSYISRHPVHRQKMSSVRDSKNQIIRQHQDLFSKGKWAVTEAWTLHKEHQMTSFKLKLHTGRTHQIRVHLSEMGHPLVGDITYGAEAKQKMLSIENQKTIKEFKRFFLHAAELGFIHPKTNQRMNFFADWPEDLKKFLTSKGFKFDFTKF